MTLFGMSTPATLSRRSITGQSASGAPSYAMTVVWSGTCYLRAKTDKPLYGASGVHETDVYTAYLPYLVGNAAPRVGDVLSVNGTAYNVEGALPKATHHLEVALRLVVP